MLVVLGLATLGCRGIYAPTLADGGTENGNESESVGSQDVTATTDQLETSDTLDATDTDSTDDATSDTVDSPETSDTDPRCDDEDVEVGSGCMGVRAVVQGAGAPIDLVLVNASGDPGLDVIVADQAGAPLVVTTLGGMVGGGGVTITTTPAHSLALLDADNNGQLDIAAAGSEGVTVVRPVGGGAFVDHASLDYLGTIDVAAGDIDNDGFDDVVIATSSNSIAIEFNQADTFVPGPQISVAEAGNLAVGDFDGDDDIDIAAVDPMTVSVNIFINSGGFMLATQTMLNSVYKLTAGDLDGDGDDEVVATSPDHAIVAIIDFDNSVIVQAVGVGPRQVALGDVDGDEVLDIVTANRQSGDVSILLGDGNGEFAPEIRVGAPSTLEAESVVLGDLDEDGYDEIVVGGLATDSLTVFGY